MEKIEHYKYRITRFKRIYMVKKRQLVSFFGHIEQFFSLQYSKIVTGSTAAEGGLLDPGEMGRNIWEEFDPSS